MYLPDCRINKFFSTTLLQNTAFCQYLTNVAQELQGRKENLQFEGFGVKIYSFVKGDRGNQFELTLKVDQQQNIEMHIDNKYSEHDSYVVTQLRQYQANNDQESAQRTLQYTSSNFPVCRIKSSNSDYLPSTKDRLNAILDKKDGLTIMDNVTHLQDVLKDMISEMKNPPKNNFMGDPDCILKAKEFFQFLNVKTPFTFDNLLEQLTFDNCANYQDYEQEKYIATMNSNMAFCKKYGFTSSENSYIYNDLDNSIYFDQATNSVIYSDQNFYFVAFKNEDKGWNVYHSQQTTEEFEKLFENTVPLENLVLKIDKTKFKQVASHMYSFHYNVYGTPYAFSCEDKTEFVAKTKPKMK